MPSYLEVWALGGPTLMPLGIERLAVGAHPSNDVVIASDTTVSRLHAVFEPFPSGWCVRDLSSRNGTFVNGERVHGERPVFPGDEVRVGKTRLVFRGASAGPQGSVTDAAQAPPPLTRRELDVLVALCRPVLSGDLFTEPASIRAMAAELVVSEAAVKQHLLHLYDKFAVFDETSRRRVELANEAIRRGAVTLADLRRDATDSRP